MTKQKLTPDYVNTLQNTREGQPELFLTLIQALRASGWPLSYLASALGVSKTAVSKWESKIPHQDFTPATIENPPRYLKRNLSAFEAQQLSLLTKQACTVRRFTDPNAPSRNAAKVLEEMLHRFRAEGVTVTQLAHACGVTRRAVSQRLEKKTNV